MDRSLKWIINICSEITITLDFEEQQEETVNSKLSFSNTYLMYSLWSFPMQLSKIGAMTAEDALKSSLKCLQKFFCCKTSKHSWQLFVNKSYVWPQGRYSGDLWPCCWLVPQRGVAPDLTLTKTSTSPKQTKARSVAWKWRLAQLQSVGVPSRRKPDQRRWKQPMWRNLL